MFFLNEKYVLHGVYIQIGELNTSMLSKYRAIAMIRYGRVVRLFLETIVPVRNRGEIWLCKETGGFTRSFCWVHVTRATTNVTSIREPE